MTNVQVEAEFGHGIEKLRKLVDRIELPREVLNHDAYAAVVRDWKQFAHALQVSVDDVFPVVHRHVAVRVEVHPRGAELTEPFNTAFEVLHRRFANAFKGAAQGQIISSVANDLEIVIGERFADVPQINLPDG